MTTSTVRPDATSSGGGSFNVTGAASAQAATSDNTDASYIRKNTSGTASIILGLGTVALASGQAVRRVRVRARVAGGDADTKANLYLGTRAGGVNYFTSAVPLRGNAAIGEISGAWYSAAPDGAAWDQTRLNELRAQFTDYRDNTSRAYLYEVYVDVDVAQQPTTTATAPTGTITTTALPDVSWTFADTESEAQSYYRAKVFTAAQYGAAGFDPETATAVWDSGIVPSVDTTTTVQEYLADGTYRVYVKTAKTVNGQPFWSAWAYSGFSISLTKPTTPSLVAVWSEALGKVTVTATGAALPVGFSAQVFEVHRSDDGGTTWAAIRDGLDLEPNSSYVASVIDYEAPRQGVHYRVRSVGTYAGNAIASAWSASVAVTVTNDARWWFKVTTAPSLNLGGVRVLAGLDLQQQGQTGVFRPIGRDKAIVIEGGLGGMDGSYEVHCSSAAAWTALAAVIRSQATVLVQDPFGEQKYVRFTGRSLTQQGTPSSPIRVVSLPYVEVDG